MKGRQRMKGAELTGRKETRTRSNPATAALIALVFCAAIAVAQPPAAGTPRPSDPRPLPPPVLIQQDKPAQKAANQDPGHEPTSPDELAPELLGIRRVYVDRLTGGETAAQMRDLVITSLQNSKLFILTENPDRADATLRGAAEDLIFTDAFSSSEGINARGSAGNSSGVGTSERYNGAGSGYDSRSSRNMSIGVGENESSNIKERKHEAIATVRLVNKDGDVIWSTTQESNGAKFRGASADVAEKITKQLVTDVEKLRRPAPRN